MTTTTRKWIGFVGLLAFAATAGVASGVLSANNGYGVGDGSNTFNLPSLRGKFLRGWANGSANDPDRATRTDRGDGTTGDNVGTQQAAAYENHGHALRFSQNNTNGANTGDGKYGFTAGVSLFALQTTTGVTTYPMYGNDYAQGYTAALDDGSGSSGTSAWETRPYNVAVAFVIKY